VVVVLGLLILGACVSLALGIDPYRSIAIGSLAFCGVGLFRAEEGTRIALLLVMTVAALALVVV
jgi:hypothetical protein